MPNRPGEPRRVRGWRAVGGIALVIAATVGSALVITLLISGLMSLFGA
jgi:hypothetical protein